MNEQPYSIMNVLGNSQRQPAFIRFKNNTHYIVEIIWINVDNKEKTYNFLAPKEFLDVNTYSTHPWIFRFVYFTNTYFVFTTICTYLLLKGNAYQRVIW